MKDILQLATRYFQSYEEREAAFSRNAFSLIPCKHLGPGPFWKDFRRISLGEFAKISSNPISFITSNPRDCLAFGTPRQVLAAACMCAGNEVPDAPQTLSGIAEAFGITGHLDQPVRTLSGGETVKLALAKSYAAADCTERLAISSPFSWLSRENAAYFHKVFRRFNGKGLPVNIYALEGEDSEFPVDAEERRKMEPLTFVDFALRLRNVRFSMGTSFNALHSHRTYVTFKDFYGDLASPCLLVGGNGQGKSLMARVLAGAIPFSGDAAFKVDGARGRARLLFQDVIAQTLLRPFKALAESGENAMAVYGDILSAFDAISGGKNRIAVYGNTASGSMPQSLLETKAVLVAVRLSCRPGALILDEPDWGMTRSDAVAFVAAIIRVAHSLAVPVVIISHKPWWMSVAGTSIRLQRTPTVASGKGKSAFTILLRQETEAVP